MKLNVFSDLIRIFYPDLCIECKIPLLDQEKYVCINCLHQLPQLPITDFRNNVITQIFYGKVTIQLGYSLLIYRRMGMVKNIIQELKYRGNESIGIWLGKWIGSILEDTAEFQTIDYIIPVPLHPKKLRSRGYNQVSRFAHQISIYLNKPVLEHQFVRVSSTKTQTLKARMERFSNVNTKFQITNPGFFRNKHILLVDDVITTGATLTSCAEEFTKIGNCNISVLSMAYTE